MSIFSDNMVFLRGKKNLTQQKLADDLILTRARYISYEYEKAQPPIDVLIRISKYYSISIDLLVTVNIRKYPLDDILNLPNNRILLPVIVDKEGNNYIEIVPQKASMGYLKGFSDPEYIENLMRILLPFLKNGKYRGFLADGDSMPPFADQSIIIGEYVEKLDDLKPAKDYIFVTKEGITYKTFLKRNKKSITIAADNLFYEPYEIALGDVVEVWSYVMGILPKDYKPLMPDYVNLKTMIGDLKTTILNLENKVSGF
ncbi:transcriptional regulator with XRE-family HTH domain [Chryseobacterium ginsenosidimutans]|uniref:LexA family transcriptional regulator n=1 Tax=Chryseobacterium ginsenosidimutans TaxID=687846 RepID=UPI00216A94F1|nr:LexA family transcriptional regulator [Chryseobacterium ginsenosidimutans]MCS3869410.1 transcriptional regulator with XRE-family HTH domain [Chryseobacterium ginsenosidimutans]